MRTKKSYTNAPMTPPTSPVVAVSTGPQSLTGAQKTQAQQNMGLPDVLTGYRAPSQLVLDKVIDPLELLAYLEEAYLERLAAPGEPDGVLTTAPR